MPTCDCPPGYFETNTTTNCPVNTIKINFFYSFVIQLVKNALALECMIAFIAKILFFYLINHAKFNVLKVIFHKPLIEHV